MDILALEISRQMLFRKGVGVYLLPIPYHFIKYNLKEINHTKSQSFCVNTFQSGVSLYKYYKAV